MKKYQGQRIVFNINLNDKLVSNFTNIYAYMYTDSCNVVKFSYPAKTGFETLASENDNKLSGAIPSENTKNMCGLLYCDLFFDGDISKTSTGIEIMKNLIKSEL